MNNTKMTITEVAEIVGVSSKTIMRWEKIGKIQKAPRDWRGWRAYDQNDLHSIKKIKETLIEA